MPGKDHVDYYYVKFSARAELQNEEIDITGFEIRYGLNMIPMATIYPTVGREPQNNKEAHAVQALLAAQPFTPVKIYATFETDKDNPGEAEGFPHNSETLLFDGYITGVTYQSNRSPAGGSVMLTAGAAGWLIGLRGTTAQSVGATVKGPGGFAEVLNLNNNRIALFEYKMAFTTDGSAIVTNLWTDFIKPFFGEIVNTESVWGDAPNDSANSALNRMDNENIFAGAATNELPFKFGEEAPKLEITKEYVGQALARDVYTTWRSADLWAALMNIAYSFKFAVVTTIKSASCVAAYPALNGKEHRYITTNDYTDIQLSVNTPAKIVKVVVVGQLASSPYAPTPVTSAIIGLHSAENVWNDPELGARGHTLSVDAPPWLAGLTPIGTITRDSLGGNALLIPDALNPNANVITPADDYQEVYSKYVTSDLGDRYAKVIAQTRLFAERHGSVVGRFRLDIAPGSLVKVQVIDDKFAEEGSDEKAIYGQVQTVELSVRAGAVGASGTASTKFDLGFVRTAAEHEYAGDALTASKHPLYDTRFVGAKLCNE